MRLKFVIQYYSSATYPVYDTQPDRPNQHFRKDNSVMFTKLHSIIL